MYVNNTIHMNQDLSQLTPEVALILGINNRTCISSFEVLLYADPAKTVM